MVFHKGIGYFVDILSQFFVSLRFLVLFQFFWNFEQPLIEVVEDSYVVAIVLFFLDFVFENILVELLLTIKFHFP